MAHALPPLRTSGSKHGHLAALLAAQPRTRDPRDGVEKVLREQIALASQSANRRVERITRVEAILPARQTDDVHLSDWGDGEQLGGDPVPFDEDDDCVERISFDPQSHLLQLDAGLSALAATAPKPLLPFSQSPPDTRPENPCEVRAANPHAIDDSRTISDSRARFIKYDKDKDGELSKREVAKLFRDMEMEIDERKGRQGAHWSQPHRLKSPPGFGWATPRWPASWATKATCCSDKPIAIPPTTERQRKGEQKLNKCERLERRRGREWEGARRAAYRRGRRRWARS